MPVSAGARAAVRRVRQTMEMIVIPVVGVGAYLVLTEQKRAAAARESASSTSLFSEGATREG